MYCRYFHTLLVHLRVVNSYRVAVSECYRRLRKRFTSLFQKPFPKTAQANTRAITTAPATQRDRQPALPYC